jgi:hypothetical protein
VNLRQLHLLFALFFDVISLPMILVCLHLLEFVVHPLVLLIIVTCVGLAAYLILLWDLSHWRSAYLHQVPFNFIKNKILICADERVSLLLTLYGVGKVGSGGLTPPKFRVNSAQILGFILISDITSLRDLRL